MRLSRTKAPSQGWQGAFYKPLSRRKALFGAPFLSRGCIGFERGCMVGVSKSVTTVQLGGGVAFSFPEGAYTTGNVSLVLCPCWRIK